MNKASSGFIYSSNAYENDYLFPYHWTIDKISLSGMQYYGYLELSINMLLQKGVKKVLDVGCGDGRLCAELASKGIKVTGIDFSNNAIDHCKRLVPKARFICQDILDPNALIDSHNYFDAISLIDVIEHVPPKYHSRLLKKIHYSLNIEGTMVLAVPSINYPLTNEQHYKHFSLNEIYQLIEGNGYFNVLKIIGNHHRYFLKMNKIYRLIDNRYYDLKFIRRILFAIYQKKVLETSLDKACRYIIKAEKIAQ
jgi:cyclopropane fatty-acyl-phospholipid synthase-like methyltransferase